MRAIHLSTVVFVTALASATGLLVGEEPRSSPADGKGWQLDKEATRQKLDALWSDLYADDPAAANAVIELYKHPDVSVPFLKEKFARRQAF